MKTVWICEPYEITQVRSFIAAQQDNAFVRYRITRNVSDPPTAVELGEFWELLVGALLTSQQRSGPDSYVSQFLRSKPFPLSYGFYEEQQDPEAAGRMRLQGFRGIRFSSRIAGFLAQNYVTLRSGLWPDTAKTLGSLIGQDSPRLERQAAEFVRHHFVGCGPKQSRNLLQGLGLTKYEIPIDSRITKWLKDFGFPVRLSAGGLTDPDYYNFVSDGIQALCRQSDVLPCVFDAAVFSSYDMGWTEDNILW